MVNRIICLARPSQESDKYMPIPELRLIDPKNSATNHGFVPNSIQDAELLLEWLEENLPKATWSHFQGIMHSYVSQGVC